MRVGSKEISRDHRNHEVPGQFDAELLLVSRAVRRRIRQGIIAQQYRFWEGEFYLKSVNFHLDHGRMY